MVPMITVKPMASDKAPMPNPVMIGTYWIQMIENADFVPEAGKGPAGGAGAPKADHDEKSVELHQAPMAPIARTKITMHNGAEMFVEGSVAELAGLMG